MPPSVQGARPCHRAHVRVVKLRGAPAHDVTADLDEGRIAEQEPIRLDRSLPFQSAFSVSRFSECLCRP